jgi:hypothetical protein
MNLSRSCAALVALGSPAVASAQSLIVTDLSVTGEGAISIEGVPPQSFSWSSDSEVYGGSAMVFSGYQEPFDADSYAELRLSMSNSVSLFGCDELVWRPRIQLEWLGWADIPLRTVSASMTSVVTLLVVEDFPYTFWSVDGGWLWLTGGELPGIPIGDCFAEYSLSVRDTVNDEVVIDIRYRSDSGQGQTIVDDWPSGVLPAGVYEITEAAHIVKSGYGGRFRGAIVEGNVSMSRMGDATVDGNVDGSDLGFLLSFWGLTGAPLDLPMRALDLNRDGIIDGGDLGVLLGHWGGACP